MFGRTTVSANQTGGRVAEPARKSRVTWGAAAVVVAVVAGGVGVASLDGAYTRDAPYRRAQARTVAQPAAPDATPRFAAPAPAPLPLVPAMAEFEAGPRKSPVPEPRRGEPEHASHTQAERR